LSLYMALDNMLNGIRLISDENLIVEDGIDLIYVPRSLSEQLFGKLYGKKWKPFTKSKLISVVKYKPDPDVYFMKNMAVGHPNTIQKLLALDKSSK